MRIVPDCAALDAAAGEIGRTAKELLSQTDLFIYGTTRATNAIVTRNIAKTALLTTAGFEDVLVLKEGGKQDGYDFTKRYPNPYIPRRHTFGVHERIDSEGHVLTELDEDQLLETLGTIRLPGPPLRFFDASGAETTPRDHTAPPLLDGDRETVLSWLASR